MKKALVVLLILFVAGAAFYFGFYKRLDRSFAESIFPQDTVAYFSIEDVTRARNRFKQTTVGKHVLDEKRVKKFERIVQAMFSSFESAAGFDAKPIAEQFTGQVAAGIFPIPGSHSGGLVAYVKNPDELQRLLEQQMDPALKRRYPDLKKSTGSINGNSYFKYTSDSLPATASPSYYVDGHHLIFSQSEEGLKLLASIQDGNGAPLKENEIFRAAKKEIDEKGVFFFLNTQNVLKIVQNSVPPGLAGFWPGFVRVSGIGAIRSFSYNVKIEGESFEEYDFLNVDPKRQGLLKIWMDTPARSMDSVAYFPKDSRSFSASTLADLAKMWDEINSRMKEILDPQKQKQWEQGQNLLRGLFNFDLKRDLAEPIGDEFAIAYEPGPPENPLNVSYLAVIRLRQPDQFKTTVSRVVAMALARGLERKQTNYKGRTIDSLSMTYGTFSMQPSFTYDQSWFVFASTENKLKESIDAKDSGGGISKNSEFNELTDDFPNKVNGISYADVGSLLNTYAQMIKITANESTELMNEYQLPQELEALAEKLHGSASYTRNQKNGILIRTHSSIPSGLLGLPPLLFKYWTGFPGR